MNIDQMPLNVQKKNDQWGRVWNNGTPIEFRTCFRNNGTEGNMIKILEQFRTPGVTKTKLDIVHSYVSYRTFKNGTECRGYHCGYFSFFSRKDILFYDSKTKKWQRGTNYAEFMADVELLRLNIHNRKLSTAEKFQVLGI
jgi:hypothetical protein